ncbi:response regulator transcription factor [Pseudonocardia sp. CA-107938]|uniref:helix-turn-helix transcriptional regulator n=1 Tax=Pseudonocardia sp. CA-107938 TaxID=3240021 RepID=UPI003D8F1EFF
MNPLPAAGADLGGPALSASVVERAEQAVQLLRGLVRCEAIMLTAANPFARTPRHEVLVADGYSERALDDVLADFVPDTDNLGFRLLRTRLRSALRWSDLARDWKVQFAATPLAENHLLPAGFHEGLTACLWLPGGVHVGAVHMNWTSSHAATDERREVVERFRPLLAGSCNLLAPHRVIADAAHPEAHVAVIGADVPQRVPGREVGPILQDGGPLWPHLAGSAIPQDGSFLWIDGSGGVHRIDLTRCAGGTVLVAERATPAPYGLTARELEVLTLLATGASNPQIAAEFVLSRRTVSTHVEHILAKLGAASRAEAAALATREGLLLIPAGLAATRRP